MFYSKTGTSSGTFLWQPPRYPVCWAFGPEEVPQFDPSRGGNPFGYVTQRDMEFETERQRIIRHPDFTDEDFLLAYGDPTLGGDKPPPPLNRTFHHFKGYGSDWMRTEVMGSTTYYPRLVRETYQYVWMPEIDSKVKVCEAAARLYSYIEDELIFRQQVTSFVRAYAPMYSKLKASDTLGLWRKFAREMHYCLRLLELITQIRQDKPAQFKSTFLETLREWFSIEDQMRPMEGPPEFFFLGWQFSKGYDEPPKKLMERIGRSLWDNFQFEVGDKIELTRTPGEFIVKCGVRGWAYKELHEAFVGRHTLKECPRCHRLFFAKNPKRKWCHDNCKRMGGHYSRKERALESE
jgi:hypothetical protein